MTGSIVFLPSSAVYFWKLSEIYNLSSICKFVYLDRKLWEYNLKVESVGRKLLDPAWLAGSKPKVKFTPNRVRFQFVVWGMEYISTYSFILLLA